jgi:hypothetical protein
LQGSISLLDQILGPSALQKALNPIYDLDIHPALRPLIIAHPKREMEESNPGAQEFREL